MPRLLGYARVSTADQDISMQVDALKAFGCEKIVEERASGATSTRPQLTKLLNQLSRGDTLVVWKLDRAARSLPHLLQIIDQVRHVGAHFRCITSPIDTSSPAGTLMLQVLGSVAEFERALIIERTKAGLQAAVAKGRVGGNPRFKNREIAARLEARRQKEAAFIAAVRLHMEDWRTTVIKHRPDQSWDAVVRLLNEGVVGKRKYTKQRLIRHIRVAVREGYVSNEVLGRSARKTQSGRLIEDSPAAKVIATALRNNPNRTLKELAGDLQAARIRTARGSVQWPLSSVAGLARQVRMLRFE